MKCVCDALRIFYVRILLQILEINKLFLRNCAAFWRKISRKSFLPISSAVPLNFKNQV